METKEKKDVHPDRTDQQSVAEPAPSPTTCLRHARAVACTLALAMACAAGATETEVEYEATTLPETMPRTPVGNDRHVCARYDGERGAYTGTVAVLERSDDVGAAEGERAAYRLVVVTMQEDAGRRAPGVEGEAVLTSEEALELLRSTRAAQRQGRAIGETYAGHATLEGNRLRFTTGDGQRIPRTMIVLTKAGLGIVDSGAGRQRSASDGAYRCARAPGPAARPLLPDHCAQGRAGDVEIAGFPAPEAEVRLIQTALENAGVSPGPIDGILGPRTLAALIRWNQQTQRRRAPILAYETLCQLIEADRAEQSQ